MGAKKLQCEFEEKYVTTIHYSTIYAGSVVEIGLKKTIDEVSLQRFFCCFKLSINGFLIRCRPYLSIDATTLNGRWNGQLASATALDGHNWMFPVAFELFENVCKGLENAVKAVFPWAEHREYFIHLMKNFSKRFQGHAMLLIVVCHLNVLSRQLGHLKVKVSGRDEAEVTEITDRHKEESCKGTTFRWDTC
ncbi:hypothetical protein AAHA92_15727 [Salvia divinorum]|uniref:MULE transposase domain-containing protein n=1 Tax=Salvia divinorum TaxID=28513 RepID=A0ABD1HIZ0_SALDI